MQSRIVECPANARAIRVIKIEIEKFKTTDLV